MARAGGLSHNYVNPLFVETAVTKVLQLRAYPFLTVHFQQPVSQRCWTITKSASTQQRDNGPITGIFPGQDNWKKLPCPSRKLSEDPLVPGYI